MISDHARIESAKKHSYFEIFISKDWFNFVKLVRGKIPLNVIEMKQENFKSFSKLLTGPMVKRTIDTNEEKVNWLKIVWLQYDKNFGIIQFKYSLDDDIPFRHLDLRKGALRARTNITKHISHLIAPQTYSEPVPVDVEKKRPHQHVTFNRLCLSFLLP